MAKPNRTPNDQRSDAFNPTSKEYHDRMNHNADLSNPTSKAFKDNADNRSDNMNQNNPAHSKSRGKK
jgi:hypothetical protein